jgi:hypothetical protein
MALLVVCSSYQRKLCNIPEARRPHLQRGRNLISHKSQVVNECHTDFLSNMRDMNEVESDHGK